MSNDYHLSVSVVENDAKNNCSPLVGLLVVGENSPLVGRFIIGESLPIVGLLVVGDSSPLIGWFIIGESLPIVGLLIVGDSSPLIRVSKKPLFCRFFYLALARQKMDEPNMNSGFASIFLWPIFGQEIWAYLDTLAFDRQVHHRRKLAYGGPAHRRR
jgi:hypothetical protein